MHLKGFGISMLLLVIFLHCNKDQGITETINTQYPSTESRVEGIKTILNPNYPRDGRLIYRMADAITLGLETGQEETILFRPLDVRIDGQSYIYVLDAEDIKVKIYDANGNWIRNVGHRGQGPGEYMNINAFDVTKDGKIFILDLPQRRITVLTALGRFVSSFPLKGYGEPLRVDESGHVFIQQNISFRQTGNSGSHVMEMILSRTNTKGKDYFEYGKFPYLFYVWRPQKSAAGVRIQSDWSLDGYTTVWIPKGDGHIYLGYSQNYLITVLNVKGKPVFKFGKDFTRIKNPDYNPDLAHPEYYPAFYSRYLFLDDHGNLWLKQYTNGEDPEHVYDVFSPEGIYIQQAIVPERIYRYQNGMAVTIKLVSSEYRETQAKRFRLVKIEPGEH